MIRTLFFVACLVAVCLAADPVDQQEYFNQNGRLGSGPFCDSKCLPYGDWEFRRDWVDFEEDYEDKFAWQADGDADWWSSGCGAVVNDLVFTASTTGYNEDALKECRPGMIYMLKYEMDYNHEKGYLVETLKIDGSFEPTSDSWNKFVSDYFDTPVVDRVSKPWKVIRLIPSPAGQRIVGTYDDDVVVEQSFVANYERNFCSFSLSVLPVITHIKCDFNFDDDDTDSLEGFVSADYCDYMAGTTTYDISYPEDSCARDSEDDCDAIVVKVAVSPLKRAVPARRFKELTASVRTNSFVTIENVDEESAKASVEATKAKRSFNYESQPIPNFGLTWGSTWALVGNTVKYTYVPYTSSIASPYCAYKD